jgi:ribonuclease PH
LKSDAVSPLGTLQVCIPNHTIEIEPEEYSYRRGNRLAAFDAAGSALIDAETAPELSLGFVSVQSLIAELVAVHGCRC